MKLKVGNQIFDSKTQPIMVILTDQDKTNIANMAEDATRYVEYDSDQMTPDEVREWMSTPPKKDDE